MLPWLHTYQQQLSTLLYSNKLAHGLLFFGPRGIGKQQLANWLLSALVCTAEQKPCQQCKSCLLRSAGNHSDLLLVDSSGSSIGVDAIRQLSQFMHGRAQQQANKVVLLPEAEKLTESAANALLKTLEEPPQNSYLILLSTVSSTLPPTLLSRCQQWPLAGQFDAVTQQWLQAQTNRQGPAFLLAYCGGGPLQALSMLESGEADQVELALHGIGQFIAGQHSLEQLVKQLDTVSSLAALFGWYLRQSVLPLMIGEKAARLLAIQQLYRRFCRDERQIIGQNKALALSAFLCELKRLQQ